MLCLAPLADTACHHHFKAGVPVSACEGCVWAARESDVGEGNGVK